MGPERHPGALGQAGRGCWAEIWPIIGPQIDLVMRGEGSVWQEDALVPVTRYGKREQVWWTYSYSPIRDESGGVGGVLVVCNDVTARHQMTRELRTSEERLAFALEAGGGVGIWDWDVPNDKVYTDARFAEFFAVQPAAALAGVPISAFIDGVHPEDRPALTGKIERILAGGGDFNTEYRVVGLDTRVRWLLLRGLCKLDAQGRPLRFGGVATDTTEQHRIMDALEDLNRRQTEFLATLAHELRNPLAPLRNGLQVVRLAKDRQELVDSTHEMMGRQLGHMARLVDDLMDVNRVNQGKVELRRENLPLMDIVNQAIETVRPLLESSRHHLTTVVGPDVIHVNGDATRLVQILGNLLNNAAKYTPAGGEIRVAIDVEQAEAVVRVSDNGLGIPADMLPRIFDMFIQVDNSLEKVQGGLGIGLSLVKALVELHGGSVSVASAGKGQGSEFTLRLPLADAGQARQDAAAAQAATPSRRVLVTDDNHDGADSLAELLSLMGHEVRVAYSGAEALSLGARFKPDVVLLDIGMPELSGYDCARLIRVEPWGEKVTLIALTGWGQSEDRQKSAEAGFDHHLVKPVNLEALMGTAFPKG
ncbi:MAG: chemotaxis protein methyltransferase CheR [Mucilaginibacter sp.]|nr:chemotaxis protein methyltransferase CheR [Mucilaginibacter sp.]